MFVKTQSDSDCKIILKAIKWMQKIRNKQATWSWGLVRRCRKVRYYRHQAPKKHSMYRFVEREKMDDILTELNLETLAAVSFIVMVIIIIIFLWLSSAYISNLFAVTPNGWRDKYNHEVMTVDYLLQCTCSSRYWSSLLMHVGEHRSIRLTQWLYQIRVLWE